MTPHKLAIYKDGFKDVEFCRVCGAEGFELWDFCNGKTRIPNLPDDPQKKLDDARDLIESLK